MNPYVLIIAASLIVIVSYFFNLIAKRTNVPSVLMLITLGVLIKLGMNLVHVPAVNWFPILEVLGIIGVIMIVLEAALDLRLSRDKWPIIWKSFMIALLSLLITGGLISLFLQALLRIDILVAILYAIPLSIISSAIVIPSVANMESSKREFIIYESTFSDIMGILAFYFILGSMGANSSKEVWMHGGMNMLVTVVISVGISYALVFLFQNIRSQVKLFLLVAVLILLYAVAKQFHLSALLIIFVFGLLLGNRHIFFRKRMGKYLNEEAVKGIYRDFKMITIETSFVLRTFFFVIFGITISLVSLMNYKVLLVSVAILAMIFGVRYLLLLLFVRKSFNPQLFLAPRGLITVLLYYAIPKEYRVAEFNQGILLMIILVTSILMAWALIHFCRKKDEMSEMDMLNIHEPIPLKEDNNESNTNQDIQKDLENEDYNG